MFREIKATDIGENVIDMISREWMLITAGNKDGYNMMTASWGFMGEMWGNHSALVVVRPTRYTMKFIEENDYFTLSFYGENKEIHKVCGGMSGRDVNKTALTGLTPCFCEKAPYFCEARLVIVCKKQYVGQLTESGFTDKEPLRKWYDGDLHYAVIGKIEKVLVKK